MIGWLFGAILHIALAVVGFPALAIGGFYLYTRWKKRPTHTGGQPMLGFMKAFAGTKGREMAKQLTESLVAMDPKAASSAQLKVMEADLDRAGQLLNSARQDHQRATAEYETDSRRFHEGLGGAEVLKRKIAAANDLSTVKPLQDALDRLLANLEEQKGHLDIERVDVEHAVTMLADVEAAYSEKAAQLAHSKSELERATRDMGRANAEAARAHERAESAAQVAGLRGDDTSGLTTAIDALKNRAAAKRAEAQVATDKAAVLKATASPLGDAVIAAAIAEGNPGTAPKSAADRLAALQQ